MPTKTIITSLGESKVFPGIIENSQYKPVSECCNHDWNEPEAYDCALCRATDRFNGQNDE